MVLALLAAFALAFGMAGSPRAQEADPDRVLIDEMVRAAEERGVRIVVIEPGDGAPGEESAAGREGSLGASSFAVVAGQVAKRVSVMFEDMADPDWPQASSHPMKPLMNGILTLMGLAIGYLLAWRLGLAFRPNFRNPPAGTRPARILRAVLGIGLAVVIGAIPGLAMHGGGSKTVELIGKISDLYVTCLMVITITGALMERTASRRPAEPAPGIVLTDFPRVYGNIRIALGVIFGVIVTALVVTFMYPDPTVLKLAQLIYLTFVTIFAAWLASHHRVELEALARRVMPPRFSGAARSLWIVLCVYLLISWGIGGMRIMLADQGAIEGALAPAYGLIVGISVYHVIVYLAGLFLGRVEAVESAPAAASAASAGPGTEAAAQSAPAPMPLSENRRWIDQLARAAGTIVGVGTMLVRLGLDMRAEDGTLGFVPAAAVVLLFAYGIWSYASNAIDRRIAMEVGPADGEEDAEGGTGLSRLATLLPLFRKFILGTVIFLVSLIMLYEAGIDITPIFASAGIIGLAIGFGAQSLVKDVISGLFFLLDDAFRLGEYIETAGLRGRVERISIRSMQLRHHNGPLNTIPFGSITELTNYSRDWVIMKLPIKVTLDTDPERLRKLVKKLGVKLLDDPMVGHKFMEPLKSQGVLAIDNWGMTVRVKFKTKPGDQFLVRRVVYAALHDMFEREGIEFASRDVKIRVANAEAEGAAEAEAVPPPAGAERPAGAAPAAGTSGEPPAGQTAAQTAAQTGAAAAAVTAAAAMLSDDEDGQGGGGGDR